MGVQCVMELVGLLMGFCECSDESALFAENVYYALI
jgi:hypothetical protein